METTIYGLEFRVLGLHWVTGRLCEETRKLCIVQAKLSLEEQTLVELTFPCWWTLRMALEDGSCKIPFNTRKR